MKKWLKKCLSFIQIRLPQLISIFITALLIWGFTKIDSKPIIEFFKSNIVSNLIPVLMAMLGVLLIKRLVKFLDTDKADKNDNVPRATYFNTKISNVWESALWDTTIMERFKQRLQKEREHREKDNYTKSTEARKNRNIEISLINRPEQRFLGYFEKNYVLELIEKETFKLTDNTKKHIDRVQRNSIVNLIIGILGTLTSIGILAYSILSNKSFNNIESFIIYFLPKLTFTTFIQLFAFFFLRLYKSNLEDAKYFQNELTNLVAKSSALKIAYITHTPDKVSQIVEILANTERNFKVLKDETLPYIEKIKIEKDFDSDMLSIFKDFMKVYKKEKE